MACRLLRVHDLASNYFSEFEDWQSDHMRRVVELPIGEVVLGLPIENDDIGWRPILYCDPHGAEKVRFGWMHPQCATVLPECNELVMLGHTEERRYKPASHPDIGSGRHGVRHHNNTLVLDARWNEESDKWKYFSRDCSGHCFSVVAQTISNEYRMYHILRFAEQRCDGLVCCEFGKHRSVAAGRLLQYIFSRRVSYQECARPHCNTCCQNPVSNNVDVLVGMLRRHKESDVPALLLSTALSLC